MNKVRVYVILLPDFRKCGDEALADAFNGPMAARYPQSERHIGIKDYGCAPSEASKRMLWERSLGQSNDTNFFR